jgi:RimJ/RimL family protein N-acetyltransferase
LIYPLHHYPTQLIDVLRLSDGTRVVVRPALPQDKDMQRAFVRGLSDEARYHRFMTRLNDLPEAMAERFTAIDYVGHVALVAEMFTDVGATMIGEARYIVDAGDAAACEFAVAVAADWQGTGLGRALLTRLIDHAASAGIHRIAADAIATNIAMIALAKRTGFAVARSREDGRLVHLVKDLAAGNHLTSFAGAAHPRRPEQMREAPMQSGGHHA